MSNHNELSMLGAKYSSQGKTIVRTNGCFDIMHPGHIATFHEAKKLGDILVVGINSDLSPYRSSKPGRPINNQKFRATMVDAIQHIDYVCFFDDETPITPILLLQPHIILKGGDYLQESVAAFSDHDEEVIVKDLTDGYTKAFEHHGHDHVMNEGGYIVGSKETIEGGGRVVIVKTLEGYSTTNIVNSIRDVYGSGLS